MKKSYAVLFALLAFAVLARTSAMADVWGDKVNDPSRFLLLPGYGGTAVQDQETGLVWEQSPSTTAQTWWNAQATCLVKTVGDRLGWRLPTIQELASLVDPTVPPPGPTLPAGHPFSNVQPNVYWSATTNSSFQNPPAWAMQFINAFPGNFDKSSTLLAWCVRGGQGVNPQP